MAIVFDQHKKARGVNDRHHSDAKSSKYSLNETPRHAVVWVETRLGRSARLCSGLYPECVNQARNVTQQSQYDIRKLFDCVGSINTTRSGP